MIKSAVGGTLATVVTVFVMEFFAPFVYVTSNLTWYEFTFA